ncbi:MAG: hypothetical protein V3U84_05600 [Thiotrichaceae bacterium]
MSGRIRHAIRQGVELAALVGWRYRLSDLQTVLLGLSWVLSYSLTKLAILFAENS